MVASENEPVPMKNRTTAERTDRELILSRTFDAPAHRVYEAWTKPEQFRQWWVPKSSGATLLSCEQDVRVGGGYQLEFAHPQAEMPMAFFGKYLDVVPNARIVWTNEESEDGAVTTVTFDEKDGKTLLMMRDVYRSKDALDQASEGMDEMMSETFGQLDAFLEGRSAAGT